MNQFLSLRNLKQRTEVKKGWHITKTGMSGKQDESENKKRFEMWLHTTKSSVERKGTRRTKIKGWGERGR